MVSKERLQEVLDYNPEIGVFTWKVATTNRVQVGSVAGCKGPRGSIMIRLGSRQYSAHRLAWLYVYGDVPDGMDVIHSNYKNSDNRIENLRCITKVATLVRCGKIKPFYPVKKLGVYCTTSGWKASIKVNSKSVCLGTFSNKDGAEAAYSKAKRRIKGGSLL
jgi:hypothetical protein